MEPNHMPLNYAMNPAYGVVAVADEGPYCVCSTIPEVPREYEVPIENRKLNISVTTTDDGAQNMPSQQSPTCGNDGIEIVYEGVSSTVCDTKGRDGDSNNCCITEMQGSDGENDYYINNP